MIWRGLEHLNHMIWRGMEHLNHMIWRGLETPESHDWGAGTILWAIYVTGGGRMRRTLQTVQRMLSSLLKKETCGTLLTTSHVI
ncbi:unnamed protein product, partial [Staurois parvus]